jgi:OTU-like cysteine protease
MLLLQFVFLFDGMFLKLLQNCLFLFSHVRLFGCNLQLVDGTRSVIEMASDGNCLFRSLSDQLYHDFGNHHVEVRDDVVDYMEEHKDDFVVFLVLDDKDSNNEDAADFESYCDDMRQDGTWGGNLELVAAAKFYR